MKFRERRRTLARVCLGTLCFVPLVCMSASLSHEPIKPIPEVTGINAEKAALGKRLYFEKKLSKNEQVSCASCHDLDKGGADTTAVSKGIEGRDGHINSPTVFNSSLLFRQFWDGRAETLEDQIDGPVQNPNEMGSIWADVVAKLLADKTYPALFDEIYPDSVTRNNIKNALAEFERTLLTPNSRFDQYLKGDSGAITAEEKEGYALFKSYGCTSCHQGAAVGGNMFQVFGVVNAYFKQRGNIQEADFGRFNVTGNRIDRHSFKVPSLRMVAHTAPYLHDGTATTLRDAVDAMFKYQLGREAPSEDKDAIVAFLKTLAGEYTEYAQ